MSNPSDLKRLLDALPLLRESGVMRVRVGDIEIEFGHPGAFPDHAQDQAIAAMRKDLRVTGIDQIIEDMKKNSVALQDLRVTGYDHHGDNHPRIVVDPTLGPHEAYIYDTGQVQSAIDNLTISRDTDTVDVDNETTHETSTDSPAMDDDVRERVDLDLAHVED